MGGKSSPARAHEARANAKADRRSGGPAGAPCRAQRQGFAQSLGGNLQPAQSERNFRKLFRHEVVQTVGLCTYSLAPLVKGGIVGELSTRFLSVLFLPHVTGVGFWDRLRMGPVGGCPKSDRFREGRARSLSAEKARRTSVELGLSVCDRHKRGA